MREIILDTETTGLDPLRGDRLVEIGCVEIFNRMPTGQTFHRHLNPERDMPAEAFAVHGLSSRVPRRQAAVCPCGRGVSRIHRRCAAGDSQRVVRYRFHQCRAGPHQAAADRARAAGGYAAAGAAQASRRFEPARRSLLALCDRQFPPHQAWRAARRGIAGRGLYRPDRRAAVAIDSGERKSASSQTDGLGDAPRRQRPVPLAPRVTEADRAAHWDFVATLGDKPVWHDFF